VVNLGSGEDHRVVDMAGVVNGLAGGEAGVVYIERRGRDVKTGLLSSIEKARRLDRALYRASIRYSRHCGEMINKMLVEKLFRLIETLRERPSMGIFRMGFE